MADITARLPAALSTRLSATSTRIGQRAGSAIDFMIAGIPFLSAADSQRPFVIETADMKRDQFDAEAEPGEQSLQGWWLRSQDSWHGGAGAKFQEPRESLTPSNKFRDSSGVDVWTEGQLTLLRRLVQSGADLTQASCLDMWGSTIYMGVGPDIRSVTLGSTAASTLIATATSQTWADITVSRGRWYAITYSGVVYNGAVSGGAVTSYPLTRTSTNALVAAPRLAWVKHRLMATCGRDVYVIDTSALSNTAATALYSHPSTDWCYTDISEGPACIYLSGSSGAESAVQKINLLDDGTIPALSAGITTAVMPAGENVQRIAILAGTWMGMATDAGFRVGALDQNGDIQYGPLTLQPEGINEAVALTAHSRWFYVSWQTGDSAAVVYRVDASSGADDGSFAWARDVETDTAGYFSDLAVYGGRVVAAFSSGEYPSQNPAAYYYQHATELVPTAWIEFGKIRYRTTEAKLFKYLAIDVEPLAGTVTADGILPGESLVRLGSYNSQGKGEFDQMAIPSGVGPQRSLGIKLTLARGSVASAGPVIHSYSVKAIPSVKPQRLIQLPLSCFDNELWSSGQLDGRDGWAKDRLAALQMLEDSGDLVIWQDFSEENASGRQVKIEKVSFMQTAPQHSAAKGRGYGGVVTLTLRTMD